MALLNPPAPTLLEPKNTTESEVTKQAALALPSSRSNTRTSYTTPGGAINDLRRRRIATPGKTDGRSKTSAAIRASTTTVGTHSRSRAQSIPGWALSSFQSKESTMSTAANEPLRVVPPLDRRPDSRGCLPPGRRRAETTKLTAAQGASDNSVARQFRRSTPTCCVKSTMPGADGCHSGLCGHLRTLPFEVCPPVRRGRHLILAGR